MRSAFSPPTAGSTTTSSSTVITSVPASIVRLAMPPFAPGATSLAVRPQHNFQSCHFRLSTSTAWQPDDARPGALHLKCVITEEAGVEPTEDAWRPPTGLKPVRVTGPDALPNRYCRFLALVQR